MFEAVDGRVDGRGDGRVEHGGEKISLWSSLLCGAARDMFTYDQLVDLSEGATFEIPRTSKHVAVLMNGASIEGVFTNRYAWHAEEIAVSYFSAHGRRMRRPRLFVGRVRCENRLSRPCKHCSSLLRRHPSIRVFYTDEVGAWVEEREYSSTHISRRRAATLHHHIH